MMIKTFATLFIVICAAPVLAQPKTSAQKSSEDRGRLVYQQVCLTCHMADGGGVPNMNPPLIKSSWVMGDKKRLINIVLKGLTENASISGHHYSNQMPAQSILSDQQIAGVLTYVRSNFGNKASAVTPGEVGAQRKTIK